MANNSLIPENYWDNILFFEAEVWTLKLSSSGATHYPLDYEDQGRFFVKIIA